MKKQMIWGLAILMLLIGIAGVFLLIPRDTDTESEMVLGEATKKLLENGPNPKGSPQEANTPEPGIRPPPPGETHETGHWDGDRWHRTVPGKTSVELPTAPQSNEPYPDRHIPFQKSFGTLPEAWTKLSLEERINVRVQDLNNFGFLDTPSGYSIRLRDTKGLLDLDENGNPILHKDYEPYFRVVTEIGFAPTREEYERYKEMQREYTQAHGWGQTAEAERINAELKAFRQACYRNIPDLVVSLSHPTTTDAHADALLQRAMRIQKEVLYAEYRKAGFDYLIPEKYR